MFLPRQTIRLILTLIAMLLTANCYAQQYIFSAPPTETREVSIALYEPIASYLRETTGEDIQFEYAGNWANYLKNMQSAKYDLLMDAAHFVSWRIEKIEHTPVFRIGDNLIYVLVVKSNSQINRLSGFRGKLICGSANPNLDALTVLDQFASGWSVPQIKSVRDYDSIWQAFRDDQCVGAILPLRVLKQLEQRNGARISKVVFQGFPVPHIAMTASARINPELRERIGSIVSSAEAASSLTAVRNHFGLIAGDSPPKLTDVDEYRGYAYLLSNYWGF